MDNPRVVLAMPRYNSQACFESVMALLAWPTRGACEVVECVSPSGSLLDDCFNKAWCAGLNRRAIGATHFAMIHADIAPEGGWLDVLYEELASRDADMVSAVVPIKSTQGLTSTALNMGDDLTGGTLPWKRKRLTMTEIKALPETFGAEDVGQPLLLNTGLWICDLRKPWVEQVCFDSMKRLVKDENGDFQSQIIPEDWLFSHSLNELGCKLYATRKVKLLHHGERAFTNDPDQWTGQWKTDHTFKSREGEPACA